MDHRLKGSTRCSHKPIPRHTPCGYCFEKWATCWDHILPFSAGGPTTDENLMPACRACNGVLSDKVFDSIEEKREYVRSYKEAHREKELPRVRERIYPETQMAKVLFTDVPVEELGFAPPETIIKP